jgi:carotenoid cleavage dioxygenase-like enzyme
MTDTAPGKVAPGADATEPTVNRYLQDPAFAPVGEERTDLDLEVTGDLPADLDGRYVRNGPNPLGEVDPATYHWFTGTGMVHGLRLRDGRAEWYRNRWVRSGSIADQLGEAPPPGPVRDDMDFSANTHVVGIGGRTFALVESGPWPVELDDQLGTIASNPFDGTLEGSFTAHPKVHRPTGELHAITYHWTEEAVRHVVVGTDAKVRREVQIPVDGRPMVHDCAVTDTRILVLDLPVQFDLEVAMAGGSLPYRWQDDRGARVGVLPLDGGPDDVVWCSVDPCYVYHPANALDLPDGTIQVDVVRHPSTFRTQHLGPDEGSPVLVRWVVDPAAGIVRETQLDDLGVEFPRFDDRRAGLPYRRAYATSVTAFDGADGSLVAYDLEAGTSERWQPGAGRSAGEFVVVPRDGSEAEDDAWLVGLVHDIGGGPSELAVLAADDVTAGPVATVAIPARIPFGFHGSWIPTT